VDSVDKTNIALIRKHGIKKWYEVNTFKSDNRANWKSEDVEGNWIRKWLPKEGKIYEVGCGALKTREDLIGVDIVAKDENIDQFNLHLPKTEASVADIKADVFVDQFAQPGSADCIVARHILEHAYDPIEAVRHWAKMIKPGGRLIIAVPDEGRGKTIPLNPDHKHGFTKTALTNLCECAADLKLDMMADSGNGISFIGSFTKK
jgi:2-polyprenyl-3-methyl-5-hydroxy-6-metoxy-1,4-benzoquinol methylase